MVTRAAIERLGETVQIVRGIRHIPPYTLPSHMRMLFALLLAAASAAADEAPLACPRVDAAPRIDGDLSDAAWTRARPLSVSSREHVHPNFRGKRLNPDSAVGADRKRDAQSFRTEVDRFVPLRIHRSALLRGDA
jgi:hypothetical protein